MLTQELKVLRRGRGVHSDRIGRRLGPELRRVCSVSDSDDEPDVRDKLTGFLDALAGQLPTDLGLCFIAAFGLEPDVRLPFYQQRLEWAAARLCREVRTVRRRVDQSIERAAEVAQHPRHRPRVGAAQRTSSPDLEATVTVWLELRRGAERDLSTEVPQFWNADDHTVTRCFGDMRLAMRICFPGNDYPARDDLDNAIKSA